MTNQNQISYLDDIPVTVIRSSRRRSFAVQINEGNFILRVPSHASMREISRSLNQFAPWIRRKYAIIETTEKAPTYSFQFGEQYPWLDTKLTLLKSEKRELQDFDDQTIPIHVPKSVRNPSAYVHKRVIQFYKNTGLQHLTKRVDYFSGLVGKHPKEVKTYSYKRRWGCCSSRGIITFNWSLLLGPASVVDYVVVHELAHLIHFDHSRSYWQVVERVMPNYRTQRKWLKENGHLLCLKPSPQN